MGDATIIHAISAATRREIVTLVFPDLGSGGDPDIERYFELRRSGRLGAALSVYNGALRVRYPDDAARVLLLRLYREGDPGYRHFQEKLALEFALSVARRARLNIDVITAPLERADLSDALRALKAVESVLARLPGEPEGALAILERYDRFARVLGYRETLVRRALALVREYDAVSRADSPADYDFVARSTALEERRRSAIRSSSSAALAARESGYDFVSRSAELERNRKRGPAPDAGYFDPEKIKFSRSDKERVEISPALARREDKVLAFCANFWPLAADPAFERTVFLYSRKFGGKHFEIFRAIKSGRARGASDDEVLSAVSGILTSSYSYSVSGDLYMQIMWRRLRARMQARAVAERLAIPGPVATTRANPSPPPESRVRARRAAAEGERAFEAATAEPPTRAVGKAASRTASPPVRRIPAPMAMPKAADPTLLRPIPKAKGQRLLDKAPSGPEPVREIRSKRGSISDAIRKLSGRGYDVYRVLFLEKVRDDIHRALSASQTRSHRIFDTAGNEAEDHIYGFVSAHYDDPFMDWEHSAERDAVEALGFAMPSLQPIIETCFKKL